MGSVDMGLLTADDFVARRSRALIDDPSSRLDEAHEIDKFLSGFSHEYRAEILKLAQVDTRPLSKDTHVIVTIIACQEVSRIRQALDTYVEQDLPQSMFEIIVLDNHRSDISPDTTQEVVASFQADNPNIAVIYAHKVWQPDEYATVGNARKYVFDIALARIHARGRSGKDTIIISNDADTIDNSTNYLSSIAQRFDTDGVVDALVTASGVPFSSILKPNVYAVLYLWDALDDVIAENEPRNLVGSSSAYRASIYAAIGGFNPRSKMAEDLETGFMIADARGWDPRCVVFLAEVRQTTDPRRILESMASRIPINEMYYKFVTSPEIRDANNTELLNMIPDSFDWELFEEDADNFWGGGDTGMYKWRGERFATDFKTAMDRIGAQYRVEDGRLFLTNIDKLINNYQEEFGTAPDVVHSQRRPYDPYRMRDIKQFFATISDSAIESRRRKAQAMKTEIEELISKGEQQRAEELKVVYERLAGLAY